MKKKVLIVIAHPDDEVIFFWWALQNLEWECSVLCCSSDAYNPLRKKWAHRKNGLIQLCTHLGIQYKCLDYGSHFYELSGRDGSLAAFGHDVIDNIKRFDFDTISTHNRWGEYGNMDHVLINYIISCEFKTMMVSDIFIPSEWSPHTSITGCAFVEGTMEFRNNLELYSRWKSFYADIRCWTWNKEPVISCRVKSFLA